MLSFFPRDILDEIWDLNESASEGFLIYSFNGSNTFGTMNIGIKHGFPCINVCKVPREMLKTEAVGRGFQHLTRDRANVNVLENHV